MVLVPLDMLYQMTSWTRAILVPLAIVQATGRHRLAPDSVTVDELYVPHKKLSMPGRKGLAILFRHLDRALKIWERRGFKNIRSAAIREAGSLDNDFFVYYEETEWCHRLRAHGWQVMLEPAARVTHLKGVSTRGKRRGAQIEMLRSRLLFYRKTMSTPLALLLSANRVLRLLLNAATNLLAAVLTLGLHARLREKLGVYFTQLAWLSLGCPEHWGLPGKCLRTDAVNSA